MSAWSEFLEGKSRRYRHEPSNLEQPPNRSSVRRAPVNENAAFHLDKRIVGKLAAGKLNPESVLDLHGKTVVEALRSIKEFVTRSRNEGLRLILVITGKGYRSQDEMGLRSGVGKLKQATQVLLESRELRRHVQYIRLAHRRHGGSGAFYVYLRRK
ncbi:MAG: Smr/MutS family protein [Rhodobacteraceae bacterium]|nr:Smr/MutS family protein [Paracoccaceae bacterium]